MQRREFLRNAVASTAAVVGCGLLLRARTPAHGASDSPIRPPGALPEEDFLGRCIRCQRCADACPNNAILPLGGEAPVASRQTPHIRPRRQACMLCNGADSEHLLCTEACPTGALQLVRREPDELLEHVHMGRAVIDEDLCYSYNQWTCGACYQACPFPGVALELGMWERPRVIEDACVGCGSCERACIRYPQAIRVREVERAVDGEATR